jgi:3-oxoacyl-[acyl-carrier protein] reductase
MTNRAGHGRVVWITGAGGGLGRALTAAFVEQGWRVAAAGHRSAPEPVSDSVRAFPMDVTDAAQVEAAAREIQARWGRLDVLINNAGVTCDRLLVQTDDAAWNRVLDVNLKGAFLCARAALGPMIARRDGLILNIASFAARSGPAGQAAYAASKAGLIGLTLALAREVGAEGIRVNAVLPGVLPTALTATLPARVREGFVAAGVLGRLNQPTAVAQAILALTDLADASGQVWSLDGRISPWT